MFIFAIVIIIVNNTTASGSTWATTISTTTMLLLKLLLFLLLPLPPITSLWPRDAIWRHRSGSTLAQVMASCLTAPSHYLNQCWLNISVALWHSTENDFTRIAQYIYPWYQFEITDLRLQPHLPGANELTHRGLKMTSHHTTLWWPTHMRQKTSTLKTESWCQLCSYWWLHRLA